ncbi:bifunctional methylenetetrahydrofolate dehydrogenase/methenyltetrahydrofolate cyclohydrolase FolD [Paludibaculum fermentans]|nr:bifunctional methylenetetrahydrofolate dehydrogenase/methenyltetrahydrofolate cyclohydrolase FolD [Paludibaculum fermentans]
MPAAAISEKRLAANRANARKSTGPRTAAGKAASSGNARRTGAYSANHQMPARIEAHFRALAEAATTSISDPNRRALTFELHMLQGHARLHESLERALFNAGLEFGRGDEAVATQWVLRQVGFIQALNRYAGWIEANTRRLQRALDALPAEPVPAALPAQPTPIFEGTNPPHENGEPAAPHNPIPVFEGTNPPPPPPPSPPKPNRPAPISSDSLSTAAPPCYREGSMARILDGKVINQQILDELKPRIAHLTSARRAPGLVVILVGNDPASEIYVRNKVKTCLELGVHSEEIRLPDTTTTAELLAHIETLNQRPAIDGILVQMPLPKQVDSRAVLLAIRPDKDVDGFHPFNVGQLVANAPAPRSCTPAGVMEILRRSGIDPAGSDAVVVGRSDIVGKPMAMLLLHAHATVTICHSKTQNLPEVCKRAQILVAAIGRPAMLTAEYIRPGAVVIDVGMNRVSSRPEAERITRGDAEKLARFEKRGSLLVGDVHPLDMAELSEAYTPVPGGVGLLTIAMLMSNTVQSAEHRLK